MSNIIKITHTKFEQAVKGTGGVLSDVAAKMGVTRAAVTYFLQRQKNNKMQNLVDEERERLIDVAENVFKEVLQLDTKNEKLSIKNKKDLLRIKLRAAEKITTTLGRKRGWVTREEREHSGEVKHNFEQIKINVIMPHDVKEEKGEKSEDVKGDEKKAHSKERAI